MSFISSRFGQYSYFDAQLGRPSWRGKRVLDFGGNVGNILKDPESTIDHQSYWCIDVSKDAIAEGKRRYPEAHWIFYDRYNFAFNPTGRERLPLPDTGQEFDFILAYSVFSHIGLTEMVDLIGQLERRLAFGGSLAFTFIDPHFNPAASNGGIHREYYNGSCLKQRLERQNKDRPDVDVNMLLRQADGAAWCILANDGDLYIETENLREYEQREKQSFCAFYSDAYIKTLFCGATVLPPPHNAYPRSTEAVLQHCCIVRKGSADV